MKTRFFQFARASLAALLLCTGFTDCCSNAFSAHAEETKATVPKVVLAETYNAATKNLFHEHRVPQTRSHPTTLSSRR